MSESLLTKRIKDWVKTALKSHFSVGNYIPMDGVNGTQKIPAEYFAVLNNLGFSSNDEYVFVILDSNDTFLFGVKADGSFTWAKGMSEELRSKLESIFGSLESLDNRKVDKEEGKGLVNDTFASGVSITINEEYALAFVDSNETLLFGVKRDGSFVFAKGVPEPVQTAIKAAFAQLELAKVDKVYGKSLIDSTFATGVSFESNEEYIFAFVDKYGTILFGVKTDGSFYWAKGLSDKLSDFVEKGNVSANAFSIQTSYEFAFVIKDINDNVLLGITYDNNIVCYGIQKLIDRQIKSDTSIATKFYVNEKITDEKTRATTSEQALSNDIETTNQSVVDERNRAMVAEQILQNAIDSIKPTTVVGGTNNPDEEFLTAISDKITFKDVVTGLYGFGKKFIRQGSNVFDEIVDNKTIYVIHNALNLSGITLTMPSECILYFDGGCLYNGNIEGHNTRIVGTTGCFGPSTTISGTWNIPYITSDFFTNKTDANVLRQLVNLSSATMFNVIHITPGNYVFTPDTNNRSLLALKDNTKLIVDGVIATTPNSLQSYNIVYANSKKNIEICGYGSLVGDVDDHDYSSGGTHEWGHCISAHYAYNIEVHGLRLLDATGDGLAIGGTNVLVHDLTIRHCGRQGISVFEAECVDIGRCVIDDIFRTAPKAAIDVEPNDGEAVSVRLHDMVISNCAGIQILYADGCVVNNVSATDCSRIVSGSHSKNVNAGFIRYSGVKSLISFRTNCANIVLHDIYVADGSRCVFQQDNVTLGPRVVLNSLQDEITGTLDAGSIKYENGRYILFNGSNWVNFDGSNLTN